MIIVGHGGTLVSIQLEDFPACHSWNYWLEWMTTGKINNLSCTCGEEQRSEQGVEEVKGHPHSSVSGFEKEKSCHLEKAATEGWAEAVNCTVGGTWSVWGSARNAPSITVRKPNMAEASSVCKLGEKGDGCGQKLDFINNRSSCSYKITVCQVTLWVRPTS